MIWVLGGLTKSNAVSECINEDSQDRDQEEASVSDEGGIPPGLDQGDLEPLFSKLCRIGIKHDDGGDGEERICQNGPICPWQFENLVEVNPFGLLAQLGSCGRIPDVAILAGGNVGKPVKGCTGDIREQVDKECNPVYPGEADVLATARLRCGSASGSQIAMADLDRPDLPLK